MSVTQQYLIDTYRAHQLGAPPPPPPGTHDLSVLRAARDERRFRAVIAGRPAHGRLRYAVRHALGRLSPARPRSMG
ncbi:hypothetical protein [Streptomyces sp. NPDC005876]|uniref:hypothetical protein n=1 Tax=unclassified Streptomyces TaxID=2593676 RepID=UPI003403EC48